MSVEQVFSIISNASQSFVQSFPTNAQQDDGIHTPINRNIMALCFSTAGSFFVSTGLISMKVGNIQLEKLPKEKRPHILRVWQMVMGLILLGCGQTVNAAAICLGNIILISSTSCLTIVFSAIFSPIMLKERFSWKLDGITILLVVSGSITAVLQQPQHIPTYADNEINQMVHDRLFDPVSIGFFGFLILLIFIRRHMWAFIEIRLVKISQNIQKNYENQSFIKGLNPRTDIQQATSRQAIKTISTHSRENLYKLQGLHENDADTNWIHFYLRAFLLFCNILSGTLAGMNCVLGKLWMLVVIRPSIIQNPLLILTEYYAWITGIAVNFTVWSNLYNLNLTISLYSQLVTMPTYEASVMFGTFMSGGIVMNEFVYYKTYQLLFIAIGLCISVVGILYKVCMLENADIEDVKHDDGYENAKIISEDSQVATNDEDFKQPAEDYANFYTLHDMVKEIKKLNEQNENIGVGNNNAISSEINSIS